MSKDKIVNGYYKTNITTSRGENSTYTTKYVIDKLQQENKQLKEVIEKVKTEISSLMSKYFYEKDFCIEDIHLDKLLQILDKGVKND